MTRRLAGIVARLTRWMLGALMAVLLCGVGGCGLVGRASATPAPVTATSPSVDPPAAPEPATAIPPIAYPVRGSGRFAIAPDGGPVVGSRGRLLRYRIAVEVGITGITATQ